MYISLAQKAKSGQLNSFQAWVRGRLTTTVGLYVEAMEGGEYKQDV